jgi:hypothetical protein
MRPEDALAFVTGHPQFLPALFRANAALASSAQLWVAAGGRKHDLFESLAAHPSLEPELVAGNHRCSLRQQLGFIPWPGFFAVGRDRCTAGTRLG